MIFTSLKPNQGTRNRSRNAKNKGNTRDQSTMLSDPVRHVSSTQARSSQMSEAGRPGSSAIRTARSSDCRDSFRQLHDTYFTDRRGKHLLAGTRMPARRLIGQLSRCRIRGAVRCISDAGPPRSKQSLNRILSVPLNRFLHALSAATKRGL